MGASPGRKVEFDRVRLLETRYDPEMQMKRHGHQEAYLTYVIAGGFTEQVGALERDVTADEVIFHPAGEEHSVKFGHIATQTTRLELSPQLLQTVRRAGVDVREPRLLKSQKAVRLCRSIRDAGFGRDPFAALRIEALSLELMVELGRQKRRPDGDLAELAAELAASLDTTSHLANSIGVHPATLNRLFRKRYGCTVSEYQRELRIDKAKELLTGSNQSMAWIASMLGFADQAHFCRAFKSATGQAPKEYQKTHPKG